MLNAAPQDPPPALNKPALARRKPASEPLVALLTLLVLAAGGYFLWRAHRAQGPAPSATRPAPAAPSAQTAAADEAETRAAKTLQSAGEHTDDRLRARLGSLSPRAEWQQWLGGTRELLESCAVLVSNFAEDEDPEKRLSALGVPPQGQPFEAGEENGRSVESAASVHRFDVPVEVINSVDVSALAPIWRSLHPLLAVAYRPLARPGVSFDQAVSQALARIENANVPLASPPLEKAGRFWIYQDPALEQQGPIEKLLIRTGPENERVLQAKARALRQALALP